MDVFERLKVVRAIDLPKQAEAPDEVIKGLLVAGRVTVLCGEPGVGKSLFALSLADAIGRGSLDFLGASISPGVALYVHGASNSEKRSTRRRAIALAEYHRKRASLLWLAPQPQLFFYDYTADGIIDVVRTFARDTQARPRLVVLDGAALNVSDAEAWYAMESLRRIASKLGVAVLAVFQGPASIAPPAATTASGGWVELTEEGGGVVAATICGRDTWAKFRLVANIPLGTDGWGKVRHGCRLERA